MQLGDILDDVALGVTTSALEITSVEVDSRSCAPGTLFFALPGTKTHGASYVSDALAHGALAVVTDQSINVDAPVIVVPPSQLRALLSHASATISAHPERATKLVGVTGTNGKTSVTTLLTDLARSLQWNAESVGTLTGSRTTPAPPELFRSLAGVVAGFSPERARSVVALEVSSHALDQHRIEGLHFCVAAFTNLSHEHLDYHGTMESYFAAKSSLFTSEFANRAVIWTDDPYGARLAESTALPVTAVRRADAADVVASFTGTTFFWRGHLVNTSLVGGYHVDNLLVAMSIVAALGADDAAVAAAAADLTGVPGRFEVIRGAEVSAIVDFAHTPEGLTRLLSDVRALAPGARVIVVMGAGGDRDRTKRPAMGAAAADGADVLIVTSDNPRSERPEAIIDAVVAGTTGGDVRREVDRRRAIETAFLLAEPGDVVVVAGKGHETTQTIGQLDVPFDDRTVVREYLG